MDFIVKKTINIEGMSCMHCVNHVTEELKKVEGVSDVQVNLEEKKAVVEVESSTSDDALKTAVEEAGYEAVGIE